MQLLQTDLCGPITDETGGKHYMHGYIDAGDSRYAVVYISKTKTETVANNLKIQQVVNHLHMERLQNTDSDLNSYKYDGAHLIGRVRTM